MLKKTISLMICLILLWPGLAYANEYRSVTLDQPSGLSVRPGDGGELFLRLTQPDSIMELMNDEEDEIWLLYELDWKINDGPWKFNKSWNGTSDVSVMEYYETAYDRFAVCGYLNNIGSDERNAFDIFVFPEFLGLEDFDLQNNTYSYRYRYVFEYDDGEGYSFVVSPYSEIASIGKASSAQIPSSLESPKNLAGELRKHEDGQPYFHFTCTIPDSVEAANKQARIATKVDWKIGSGKWATESGNRPFEKADNMLADDLDVDPIDEGGWAEVNIEQNTYYFRMYFEMQKPDGSVVRSPFSNVVELGTPAYYSNANSWAVAELDKAAGYGLIPDILKGADMTRPITREEFAELAILLYEKTSGKTIAPVSPNPFADTNNTRILQAFAVGITAGTSDTTFSPKVLINREQCAAMLFRTIKAIAPGADYSLAGTADFPDQKYISSWAVEATKYMSKKGIIKGDTDGNFMPKAITTAQEAAGYGMASREAAVMMAVRTHETVR